MLRNCINLFSLIISLRIYSKMQTIKHQYVTFGIVSIPKTLR